MKHESIPTAGAVRISTTTALGSDATTRAAPPKVNRGGVTPANDPRLRAYIDG